VRDAYDKFKIPIILVAERPHDSATADAIRSSAIACLGPKEAMQTLVFLVENVAANLLRGAQSRYASKRVLVVSDRVTLTVPDHCMTDGQYETRLPLIPGALLERLASHPNELVVFSDLIRAAWGRAEDASVNALHQQICRLREMLSQYGIPARLQSMRGRGYMLSVPESRSGPRDHSGKDP
jgi:DNA-binding response OmpR family regulator